MMDPWVYVTVGASSASDGDGVEFFILSPSESPRHVETLAMVASFHADARYRLSIGRTVNIGRAWIDGAVADHLLVSLPLSLRAKLGALRLPRAATCRFVPITDAEARYVGERGLEQLLEQSDVDVISPSRPSLV